MLPLALLLAASSAPLAPAAGWVLDPTPGVCRATRAYGSDGATMLRLVAPPLSGRYVLTVDLAQPIDAAFDDQVTLTAEPGHFVVSGRMIGVTPNDPAPRTIGLYVPRVLLTPPVAAIGLKVRGRTAAALALSDSGSVASQLAACTDDQLRDYGIDPASQVAVAVWPEPVTDAVSWFTPDAYPPAALRAGAEGRVIVKLLVGADGAVVDCAPVRSSGSADLDDGTCALARTRARYRPARDAQGHAVPAIQLLFTRWTIPRG